MAGDSAQLQRRGGIVEAPTRVLSPELVLVDRELAEWARLRLQEDAAAAEVARAATVDQPRSLDALEPAREVERHRQQRAGRRSLRSLWVAAAAAAAGIIAVTIYARMSTSTSKQPGSQRASSAPSRGGRSASLPFAWPSASGARGYVFTLSRGTKIIYRARTTREQLALKRSWAYRGRRYRLTPGPYHWRVVALPAASSRGRPTIVISAPFWIDGNR